MKPDSSLRSPAETAELRRRAEEKLKCQPLIETPLSALETQKRVNELHVHQIELEMQNEELREAKIAREEALAGYTDLYDFAPAGYVTLNRQGQILQTNLAAARLLDLERARLIGSRLGGFVTESTLPAFNVFLQEVFSGQSQPGCELELVRKNQPSCTVHIEATLSADELECRAVVADITERQRTHQELEQHRHHLEGLVFLQGWNRFLQHQTVNALRVSLAPQLAFVKARLSPGSYLGLQLTTGALVLIGASWLFGGVAEDVVHGDPLTLVDVQVAQWFHEHATPLVTRIMLVITDLHGSLAVTLAVVLIASYLAWKRNWYWLICLMLTVPFGMLLNIMMKYSFHRARPSFENPLLVASSYSFPSGHVAGATLLYGIVAAMVITQIETWRWRVMIVLGAIALVVLVALTRMYLGVHYLSDVLAAFAEGIAWLTLCLTGMNTFWHRRATKVSPS